MLNLELVRFWPDLQGDRGRSNVCFNTFYQEKRFIMRKILALLLALTLVLGLCACGGQSASAGESSEPASAPAETPAAAEEAPVEDSAVAEAPVEGSAAEEAPAGDGLITTDYTYELPLFEEGEFTFSMWVSFSDNMSTFMPNQFKDNLGYKKAAELTGVEVDIESISTAANSEQFNLRVASGDLPNVITNVSQLWTSSWDSAIEDEVFIDMTDMLEYMPAYSECYAQLDENTIRDLHTDSGYMPRLVSINNYPDGATEGAFIRTDYLEKVGLDIPETYDDLDKVLRAFQSELGLTEPLMAVAGLVHTSNALVSGFDVWGGFSTFPFNADPYYCVDGEVKFGIIEPGYKEYIEMFSTYYKDGIISPDFITKNTNPMEFIGTISAGTTGVFFGETNMVPNYVQQGQSIDPDFAIAPLAPITKEPGQITHFGTEKSPISGRVAGIAVSTTECDLEKLGKYLDFFFTYEGSLLSAMGIEGNEDGSYVFDENGELQYSDNWNNSTLSEMEKPTYFIYSVMPMLCPKTPSQFTMDMQFECAPTWDKNTDSAWKMPSAISLTVEETERYNTIYADIRTTLEENLTQFAVGDKPMDEWDAFVESIYDLGIEECLEIQQTAVDRYYER